MSFGPVELLFLKFPDNQFQSELVPALKELVETHTIRVIDILFLQKDVTGDVTLLEINELDDAAYAAFDPLVSLVGDLFTESDATYLAQALETNSSAAMMLFENTWATRFRTAIARASGQVLLSERIPRPVIDALVDEQLQLYMI